MRQPRLRCGVVGVRQFAIMTRSFLKAMARGLIGFVLMTQMVISAYACPSAANMQMAAASVSTDERGTANADMPMAQTSNCDDMAGAMDTASPNLCAEHCKVGQQSDHAPTFNVPAVVL
ncbi:MAG: hypothetical protein K2X31_00990, partial [Sphingopyxis sp.]|nr:hypothetical protein [Sphingopyxis sp.]